MTSIAKLKLEEERKEEMEALTTTIVKNLLLVRVALGLSIVAFITSLVGVAW